MSYPAAFSAGSAVDAARHLKIDRSRQHWSLQPSVGTWMRPLLPASIGRKVQQLAIDMHHRVAPWLWCVNEEGFDNFLECVRMAHAQGMIPNDPDPSTGSTNPFHDDPDIGPNMHAVNKHVIIPTTRGKGGVSWALMEHCDGLPISFFVTHSWKEGVYEFYRKVKHSWPVGMHMWCCFLANPQSWDYKDLKVLLGERDDLADSPFMRALSSASLKMFLVVPNCVESLYRRLWCVAELKKAMEIELSRGASFIVVAKDPLPASRKRDNIRKSDHIAVMLSEATCTDKADELKIRAYIEGHEQNIERMIQQISKGRKPLRLKRRGSFRAFAGMREDEVEKNQSSTLSNRGSTRSDEVRSELLRITDEVDRMFERGEELRLLTEKQEETLEASTKRFELQSRKGVFSAGFEWMKKKASGISPASAEKKSGSDTNDTMSRSSRRRAAKGKGTRESKSDDEDDDADGQRHASAAARRRSPMRLESSHSLKNDIGGAPGGVAGSFHSRASIIAVSPESPGHEVNDVGDVAGSFHSRASSAVSPESPEREVCSARSESDEEDIDLMNI